MPTLPRLEILSRILKLYISLFDAFLIQFLTHNAVLQRDGRIHFVTAVKTCKNCENLKLQKTNSKLNASEYRRHTREESREEHVLGPHKKERKTLFLRSIIK